MTNYITKYLLFAVLLMGGTYARGQLIINELMQSNIDCIMDDLNEFPDSWVELYNASTSSQNLKYYSIGLTNDVTTAWTLPDKTISGTERVVIYCDKEATGLHTDFRLDSGKGGAVYLFHNGVLVDSVVNMKKQPSPNIAYGRITDNSPMWDYMLTPTPGTANCGVKSNGVLGDVVYSIPGQVYASAPGVQLSLSVPADAPEGTEIRYTTDGSEPTASSKLYTQPFTIYSTMTLRACLFCTGYITPRSTVHSYVVLGRKQTLPVVSITLNDKYLNDSKIGIYVDGSYNSSKKNYEYDWRRPITLELFEEDGTTCSLNQLCECRIMGNATRSAKFKSLAIYANKRFGEKHLKYEFFPDQRPGITKYKSILLRNAGNDFDYLYMRDAVVQRTMAENADIDWQAWRPTIIYINGVYKGILNIRDRSNEDNIFTYYDGLEDIDMVEGWWSAKVGTSDNWNAFQTFYAEHGHTKAEYGKWIDVTEFLNIMIMNLYYNNQDFPGNNIVFWRPRTDEGRWRVIAKDTDFGLGLYGSSATYDSMAWIYNNSYDSNRAWGNTYEATRLFRRMMEDSDMQSEFIDRSAVYMGCFMNETGTRKVWDPMYEKIKTEYPTHRKLINQWWPTYSTELSNARTWVKNRTASFYTQLQSKYSLGAQLSMNVNSTLTNDNAQIMSFTFNGIPLTNGVMHGKYYAGRKVILSGRMVTDEELAAHDLTVATPMEVKGWKVMVVDNSGKATTTEYEGSEVTINVEACANISADAIIGVADGIETVEADRNDATPVATYDIQGRRTLGTRPSGIYLQRMSNGRTRKVILK